MSDRIKGFVVTLDRDYKDEDAENIRKAIQMIKGVIDVKSSIATSEDHMNRQKIKYDMEEKIWKAIKEDK